MPIGESIEQGVKTNPEGKISCDHCSEVCPDDSIRLDDKYFCCEGCKTVYEILNDNGLCKYYELDEKAGISLKGQSKEIYAYLDEEEVRERLIDFSDGEKTRVTFFLPQIHCASCIWLLENLYKLNDGVLDSRVNFLKKEIYLTFSEEQTSLRKLVELLASIGYAPAINLGNLDGDKPVTDRSFAYKLGVAGFAFGNIMLLSFPEYLGLDPATDGYFIQLFGYLNILLILPVIFYSGRDYLQSAWLGLKQRELNIDVPIALGMLTLFGRSLFEILLQSGAGYLDSLAGLVFFLLIGKWFQQRTYHNISFERDYKSYFPIAAHLKTEEGETSVSLDRLEPGQTIIVRNKELIPADAVILRGQGNIDYSFVTGEAQPVRLPEGEKVYAGGRQVGESLELNLIKKVSQSYLTQLWNDDAFTKEQDTQASKLANRVGKYFTIVILLIAFATLAYWLRIDAGIAINAFTAVLIIACPCAVALSVPFIFGNVLRILGKHEFYLKNTNVIEALGSISAVVWDKTGTLTTRSSKAVSFEGAPLSEEEKQWAWQLSRQSTHPASQVISKWLESERPQAPGQMQHWQETEGAGVSATINGHKVRLGASHFMTADSVSLTGKKGVFLQIDDQIKGVFLLQQHLRKGIKEVFDYFNKLGPSYLLSGDNDRERDLVAPWFKAEGQLHFHQRPQDKLNFIREQQQQQQQLLMFGDGLNDAGALKQSDVGIVVAENTNNFTPASDGILRAAAFEQLPRFVAFARKSIRLVYGAYAFAFIYNVIGLSFAVRGELSPVIAAILMPASSISIVLFGMLSSNLLAARMGLLNRVKKG